MAIRNIKLTIAYDGSAYHGWQIQPGLNTIQGVLTEAVRSLLGGKVRVCGASRTDAGVSALGQVGLIQIDSPIPTENLAKAITDGLPEDMAVTEAVEVPPGFDVIGAVKSKLYRYTIFTGHNRPVLQIKHCWHLPGELDRPAMAEAAKILVGKKDFKSFASAADRREDTVRTIFRCDVYSSSEKRLIAENTENVEKINEKWIPASAGMTILKSSAVSANSAVKENERNTQYENGWVYIDVEGDGFLYNMVRNIVGTLVEVGLGRCKPERIAEILEARDRRVAGPLAPAAGLCLMQIEY